MASPTATRYPLTRTTLWAEASRHAETARARAVLPSGTLGSWLALSHACGIDLQQLKGLDNHIPFANYVALMRSGLELAWDPVLALHFGGALEMA